MAIAIPVETVSRHKCLIYDGDPSELLDVVVPLLGEGLRSNERCLYLGSPEAIARVDSALAARGVDVASEARLGSLVFSADRSHLAGGRFDPRGMVGALRRQVDEALGDGFAGLCATGDMMWELGTQENFDGLLEYEGLLEDLFREKPLRGICQYRRDLVPASAVRDALLTHRSAYVGTTLSADNLFYMPPEVLQAGSDAAARARQGEWMSHQITRILAAERKRDQAQDALRASEGEQRRLAAQLARANEDLEARVRERTAELEALNKDLESFSYSVSHDLRAPLRALGAFASILRQSHAQGLGPEGRSLLDRIEGCVARTDDLVLAMLLLSRVGRQPFRRQPIDVQAIVRSVLQELADDLSRSGCRADVGELPPTSGDLVLVRQAFLNLVANAVKFSSRRSEPRVSIGSRVEQGRAVYFVRDNGAGFDMRHAERLFGAFQRLPGASDFEGTGIGLSIVQQIVRRHGGRVWAEGEVDRGATFFVTFAPRAHAAPAGLDPHGEWYPPGL